MPGESLKMRKQIEEIHNAVVKNQNPHARNVAALRRISDALSLIRNEVLYFEDQCDCDAVSTEKYVKTLKTIEEILHP